MPRAVLDPNVLFSALISPAGPSAKLLLVLRAGAFELVTSPRLFAELGDVLRREKFRRYAAIAEVDAYLALLHQESILLDDPEPSSESLSDDPDDEYLIALAWVAHAEALVSGDSHLLRLADAIPVLTPRDFLESLERD